MQASLLASQSPILRGNLLALLSTALWASGFPATEYLLRGWDPLLLCLARLTGAATFLSCWPGSPAVRWSCAGHRGAT